MCARLSRLLLGLRQVSPEMTEPRVESLARMLYLKAKQAHVFLVRYTGPEARCCGDELVVCYEHQSVNIEIRAVYITFKTHGRPRGSDDSHG